MTTRTLPPVQEDVEFVIQIRLRPDLRSRSGLNALAERWNGSTWADQTVPNTTDRRSLAPTLGEQD